MRRIVAFSRVSADAYFAAPDGGLGWVVPEPEPDRAAADSLGGSDTILFGRRRYGRFESFWPHAAGENPHAPGRHSAEMRAMAAWIDEATKIVFSRTRTEVAWHSSHLRREFDPREVEALKHRPGKDIMIFGSGSIVLLLSAHRLIDAYRFVVAPVLLGGGRTLVNGVAAGLKLDLREAAAHPSGNVVPRYARVR